MSKSAIEWTGHTWNPIVGCSVVSPGCTNCYAMRMAARLEAMAVRPEGQGNRHLLQYEGLTRETRAGAVWTGTVRLVEHALPAPLRRRKPTTYFVNSMSDLFHESVPDEWIDRVFAVMALAPHTFQVLTKRSARMRAYFADPGFGIRTGGEMMKAARGDAGAESFVIELTHRLTVRREPLPNVWLGVSAEDQARADERIPDLLATPAAIRFVSAEPLVGPIDFTRIRRFPAGTANREHIDALGGRMWTDQGDVPNPDPAWAYPGMPFSERGTRGLDWIIVGGESGPGARVWLGFEEAARSIRDQCQRADVAFFMKQMAGPTKARLPMIPADLMIRQMPGRRQ